MLLVKNLDTPDNKVTGERSDAQAVMLDGVTVTRAVLHPGWRWSEDLKPLVGTDDCQVSHMAVVLSGRLHISMNDGQERDLSPGDVHVVGPGHDAWVGGGRAVCVT